MRSKSMGRSGHVEYTGELTDPYIFLIGRAEGMRPLARTRHIWEDNFKNLKGVEDAYKIFVAPCRG
jgi:hypothetical protein